MIGDRYYQNIKPYEDGFRDRIYGRIGTPIKLRDKKLLDAINVGFNSYEILDIGKILNTARNYGLEIVRDFKDYEEYGEFRTANLCAYPTQVEGVYYLSCFSDHHTPSFYSYPMPCFYITAEQSGFMGDLHQQAFNIDFVSQLLSKALSDYETFFNLKHHLELFVYCNQGIDTKGKQLLRKLMKSVNNRPHT